MCKKDKNPGLCDLTPSHVLLLNKREEEEISSCKAFDMQYPTKFKTETILLGIKLHTENSTFTCNSPFN